MDKKALMEYALFARRELETQIALSLNKLGIYKDRISKCNIVGERTVIEGTEQTFPKAVYQLREKILSEHINIDGFSSVVEEFAYTWFNRIIALRFMEVHDYFPHGFRVLTSRGGAYEPEILRNLSYVVEDLKLDSTKLETLKAAGEDEELYRYVLFSQCNALSDMLPMLFDRQQEYMELLLPHNLLSQNSVIKKITDIPEEDFLNDIEVIGWLYQFYNSVKKKEVEAQESPLTKNTLPAVTQLFTPDWIVRYMAENSIGRLWLSAHPNSNLRHQMIYFADEVVSEAPKNQFVLEKLRILEPCCGSGHILVYVFDLLHSMYLEKGYSNSDIPALILKNNLVGLDVDKRAAQLSGFALMMKARSIDKRFLKPDRIVYPKVFDIPDSELLSSFDYQDALIAFGFSKSSVETINYLAKAFANGKVIGSLLKIEKRDYEALLKEIDDIKKSAIPNTLQIGFFEIGLPEVVKLAKSAMLLSGKYDVVITNPPYRGISSFDKTVKDFANKYYPNSKSDLFSMFMETSFLKEDGYLAMINMQTWMFLSSFEKLREAFPADYSLLSVIHLGPNAFEEISGQVVKTVAWIAKREPAGNLYTQYIRLVDAPCFEKRALYLKRKDHPEIIFSRRIKDFAAIDSTPLVYWMPERTIKAFAQGQKLEYIANPRQGMKTLDNDHYIRYWFEVDKEHIGFKCASLVDAKQSGKKWFPINHGGVYRQFYGDNLTVVNWENDGIKKKKQAIKSYGCITRTITNIDYYFKEGITWSSICGYPSFRRYEKGFLFSNGGQSIVPDETVDLDYLTGVLNSKVSAFILEALSPKVGFESGYVKRFPVLFVDQERISYLAKKCIDIARIDWDEKEHSWDFAENPLLRPTNSLRENYSIYATACAQRKKDVKNAEEEINRILIQAYGLETAVSPDVSPKLIALSSPTPSEAVKELLQYCVGVLLGRYINKEPIDSLVFSNGVAPIYAFQGMEDSLSSGVERLIQCWFSKEQYEDNIAFIKESLGLGNVDPISEFFLRSFAQYHASFFEKCPIYWMMSSGKHNAFRCIVYMHLYNKNTLAYINSKLFLPRTAMYKAERERLQGRIDSGLLDTRELRDVQKQLDEVIACEQELLEYGQVLDHMANQYIDINLDDGVKVNYAKFQGVELEVDGRTIKKDLFVPIK